MVIRGLIALAFGTLSLGIAEYVAMGLLPYIAKDFSISIASAGHTISAYALGVAIGAFSILFMRKLKLKTILLILIVVHVLGNVLTVLAPSYETMLIGRFIAGSPHGSFFGVGSIIASRTASGEKSSSAVAIMIAGMTIANVFGAPLGTALAADMSWRSIFYIVSLWGVLVFIAALLWVKDAGKIEDTGFKGQFVFLKNKAPWLVLAATLFGNAGIFCIISYVSPLLTDFASLPLPAVSAVLVAMGISMVICNLISGKLCDKFTPGKVAFAAQVLAVVALLLMVGLGNFNMVAIALMCISGGMLFAISAPEQVSILRTATGGLLLGASLVQAAFNLGNALGAYAGGLPFTFEISLRFVPLIGAVIAVIGVTCLYTYVKYYETKFSSKI